MPNNIRLLGIIDGEQLIIISIIISGNWAVGLRWIAVRNGAGGDRQTFGGMSGNMNGCRDPFRRRS